jgi:peroxiredoxin-like protein
MQPFPHRYEISASATVNSEVTLAGNRLPALPSAPPVEFGGPGDRWSPETLLLASVADCFVLTFRAIAAMSHVSWISLNCEAVGVVDRVDRMTRFTEVTLRVHLTIADNLDEATAHRLLDKAKQTCLISNSLTATVHLEAEVGIKRSAA